MPQATTKTLSLTALRFKRKPSISPLENPPNLVTSRKIRCVLGVNSWYRLVSYVYESGKAVIDELHTHSAIAICNCNALCTHTPHALKLSAYNWCNRYYTLGVKGEKVAWSNRPRNLLTIATRNVTARYRHAPWLECRGQILALIASWKTLTEPLWLDRVHTLTKYRGRKDSMVTERVLPEKFLVANQESTILSHKF